MRLQKSCDTLAEMVKKYRLYKNEGSSLQEFSQIAVSLISKICTELERWS